MSMSKKYLKKRGLDPEDVFKRTGQKLRWGHGSRKDLQRLERKARKDMKKRDDSSSGSSNSDEEKTQPKDEGRNKVSRSQSPAPRPRQAPAPTNPPKTQEPTIYSRIWNENMQSEKKKAKSRTQEPMEKEEYERPVKSKNCDVSPKLPESKDILKGSTMEAVMVEESSTNNPLALVHDQGRLFRMPQAQHGSVQHEIPILNQMSLMNLESDGSGALEADANQASFGAFLDWLLLMPPRSKNN